MITFRASAVWSARHIWIEVYVRIPGRRTLLCGWTSGLGHPYAYVIDEPFRPYTTSL